MKTDCFGVPLTYLHRRCACRECAAEHKVRQRLARWKHRYGITQEDYDAMLVAQGGGCAICGATEPSGAGDHFHVDHDHSTDRVRGLLCHHCNTAIGQLNDQPDVIRRAADYLETS